MDQKDKIKKSMINKEIKKIQGVFITLFAILIINIIYFNIVKSNEVIIHPLNPRLNLLSDRIVRGKILSDNGEVLAETVKNDDDSYRREYPYKSMFAHVVGFSSHGKSGLESQENFDLLKSNINFIERSWNEILEKKNMGNNIVTTLNIDLQKVAYDSLKALGDKKGAVVAIEPSTGKVLCMVSRPAFDPNKIDANWEELQSNSEDAILLNRATQGLYPPGSTFKVLTALEYISENSNWNNFTYACKSRDTFYHREINCYNNKAHGEVDLGKALAKSCNTAFSQIGTQLNLDEYNSLCNDFLFNQKLPFDFIYKKSEFVLNSKSDKIEIPETAIGQGKTLITPFHNALITSTIANNGIMMKPYLVDHIENYQGQVVRNTLPTKYNRIIEEDKALTIKELMSKVVTEGTATQLSDLPFTVAGKTGSAQFKEGEKTHSWFICFAPVENPQIAISILVENAGTSSENSIPIAKKMLKAYVK